VVAFGSVENVALAFQQLVDLYVCQRPCSWFTGVQSPVRSQAIDRHVIFRGEGGKKRKNLSPGEKGDIYAGVGIQAGSRSASRSSKFLQEGMGVTRFAFTDSAVFGVKPLSQERTKRSVVQKARSLRRGQ